MVFGGQRWGILGDVLEGGGVYALHWVQNGTVSSDEMRKWKEDVERESEKSEGKSFSEF